MNPEYGVFSPDISPIDRKNGINTTEMRDSRITHSCTGEFIGAGGSSFHANEASVVLTNPATPCTQRAEKSLMQDRGRSPHQEHAIAEAMAVALASQADNGNDITSPVARSQRITTGHSQNMRTSSISQLPLQMQHSQHQIYRDQSPYNTVNTTVRAELNPTSPGMEQDYAHISRYLPLQQQSRQAHSCNKSLNQLPTFRHTLQS